MNKQFSFYKLQYYFSIIIVFINIMNSEGFVIYVILSLLVLVFFIISL